MKQVSHFLTMGIIFIIAATALLLLAATAPFAAEVARETIVKEVTREITPGNDFDPADNTLDLEIAPATAEEKPILSLYRTGSAMELAELCTKSDTATDLNTCLQYLTKSYNIIRQDEARTGSMLVCNDHPLSSLEVRQAFMDFQAGSEILSEISAQEAIERALSKAYVCVNHFESWRRAPSNIRPEHR